MSKKIWYVDTYDKRGMKAALLWDESTDAWQYSSNAPAKDEEQYYRMIPTIFRGVNLISQAVSNMPFTIYQGEAEFDTSQDYQNKLEWLPSPGSLFGMISQSLDLAGRCYLRPLRNSARYVKELRYYSPVTIEPKYNEQAGALIGFIRTANSRQDLIPVKDLIYFWLKDPYVELGPPSAYPIKAAMNAAGALKSLDDFVTLYFQRGAVRPMMVYAKGMPQKEERERLEGWFNNLMGGIKNAFRWKVFNAEALDVKQIGDGLSELRDVELTEQKREDVAQALGVPFTILFAQAANYATSQQDKLNFYDDTITPRCKFIQETLNQQLLEPLGYSIDFKPESLDIYQEDEAARAQALTYYVQAGTPLLMAMDLLGVELTDEQRVQLEQVEQQKDELRERLAEAPPPGLAEPEEEDEERNNPPNDAMRADLSRWQRKALNAIKRKHSAAVEFDSQAIPAGLAGAISGELEFAQSPDEVKMVFSDIWAGYP